MEKICPFCGEKIPQSSTRCMYCGEELKEESIHVVENEKINLVDRSSDETQNIDRNWNVTEAGNYTITINQLTERMTVTKN